MGNILKKSKSKASHKYTTIKIDITHNYCVECYSYYTDLEEHMLTDRHKFLQILNIREYLYSHREINKLHCRTQGLIQSVLSNECYAKKKLPTKEMIENAIQVILHTDSTNCKELFSIQTNIKLHIKKLNLHRLTN